MAFSKPAAKPNYQVAKLDKQLKTLAVVIPFIQQTSPNNVFVTCIM